jgi:hypothetical protein
LLPMWDSILLGYDRSRVLPEQYRPLVIRRNGDVLPCLLVDGRVVGVWRPLDGGVELTAFETIDADSRKALTGEAEQLSAAVADRDPVMYKRYTHWWDKGFPGAKVGMVRG